MSAHNPTQKTTQHTSPRAASPRAGADRSGTAATVSSADGTTIGYTTLGTGEAVIVVGGVLSTARDYMGLGRVLAESFTVHVMDRRGRGASGSQGPNYSTERECEDLLALQAQTGAERVFGHSYGGFVAIQAARRSGVFRQVAVYEPMVLLDGTPPMGWLPRYRELLRAGDTRGAFATMVRHAGFAPRPLTALPMWCLQLILRLGVRGHQWEQTEALLEANLAEQQALLDDGSLSGYSEIESKVLLIGGARSPAFVAHQLEALHSTIRGSTVAMLDGLDHPAPEAHPDRVAETLARFFANAGPSGTAIDSETGKIRQAAGRSED